MSEGKRKATVSVTIGSLIGVVITLAVMLFTSGGSWGSQAKTVADMEAACKEYGGKLAAHDTAIAELRMGQKYIQQGLDDQNRKLDQILIRLPRQTAGQ